MLLDTSLFPPDVEYSINAEYGETKTFRKQVRIHIGAELFAVELRLPRREMVRAQVCDTEGCHALTRN